MLTIFTPTYNRADLLPVLYRSLCAQTVQKFEWLIVDDGSTDQTRYLIETWKQESCFPITYYYQENGGKMRAHNKGVLSCETELFLCVDSDDYLTKEAVERINTIWEKQSVQKKKSLAGIVAHKGRDEQHIFADMPFPDVTFDTLGGLYQKGFRGETTLVFRTEILKKFLFPEFDGEKYVPEDVVYDRIDREYELVILHEILTVCELVAKGYTASVHKLREDNPQAWLLYYEQKAKLTDAFVLRMKYLSHLHVFAWMCKKNVWKQRGFDPFSLLCALPGAFILRLLGKR